jgi:hypothetical protein
MAPEFDMTHRLVPHTRDRIQAAAARLGLTAAVVAAVAAFGCHSPEPTAPVPGEPFQVTFGTPNFDEGRALWAAADGDLLVAGAGDGVIAPADGTLPTPMLARLDPAGGVRWMHVYEDMPYGTALGVIELNPERIILLVSEHDDSFRNYALTLWALDASGNANGRLFHTSDLMIPSAASKPLTLLSDGALALFGADFSGNGPAIGKVVRLTVAGEVQWSRIIGEFIEPGALVEIGNGAVMVVGSHVVNTPAHDEQIDLRALSAEGSELWTRELGEPTTVERPLALMRSASGAIIAGTQFSSESGQAAPFLIEVADDGRQLSRTSSNVFDSGSGRVRAAVRTTEGNVLLTGWLTENGASSSAFLLTVSPGGVALGLETFGAPDEVFLGRDVIELMDARIALTGARGPDMPSYGGADYDALVVTLAR